MKEKKYKNYHSNDLIEEHEIKSIFPSLLIWCTFIYGDKIECFIKMCRCWLRNISLYGSIRLFVAIISLMECSHFHIFFSCLFHSFIFMLMDCDYNHPSLFTVTHRIFIMFFFLLLYVEMIFYVVYLTQVPDATRNCPVYTLRMQALQILINRLFFSPEKKKHHHTRYAHESTVTYSNIRMKLLTHTNCWFVLVFFFYSFQTNIKTPEQFGKYAGYSWKEQKLFWKYVMSILYQIVCVCCMWRKYQWPTAKRSLTKYYFRVHLFDRLFFITEMQFVCVYNWSIMVFINQWIDSVVVVESYTWLCSWKIPTQQQFCLFFFLLSVSLEE